MVANASRGPFKADVVGSLLRPAKIHEARSKLAAGSATRDDVWKIETDSVDEAVGLQKDVGLKVCTDGEYHRRHWFVDFVEKIDGVGFAGGLPTRFQTEAGFIEFSPPKVITTGKLRRTRSLAVDDFKDLKPLADKAGLTPKQPIPSPTLVHFRSGDPGVDKKAYPDIAEYYHDLAQVYRDEIKALYDAGCRYIQIDETNFPFLCDPNMHDHVRSIGEDPVKLQMKYKNLINAVTKDRPDDLTIAMHMCRGNHESAWAASGAYDFVAEVAFGELDIDAFFLEYDTERAGTFEPLKHMSKNKTAVLGLVTSKKPQLESKDLLKRRINEASKYVPLERLALSPQCGFASTIGGNKLTVDEEKAKLRLVVDTAREVWG
ncbi:5-methyltetrahydropteroyltriglutamate--homocysteine S-methyltransferase [Methylocella sp. CPCC 101449]|uniref:5-methyltetrahydropteroyltriglutamate-- homocysteine S-methyltransferase n=1 Tax=Methylocella sp. CPCC 101449 TaxID=2987531 RepID=UPI00288C7557|nr:5-methyltetrahydropteroyltriglutamate--homocysteine S-methyltransferase [Methylocella sp. CPCC 101449]MDT2024477.1 5-methyltetrahydropteroyltriglutamate--homocysteine S-methyltransferase [Methylocella sp. CPCC 101449]